MAGGKKKIQYINLTDEVEKQCIVDREEGTYLGHPTTALLEDDKTIYTVYPKGHGIGQLVLKRSEDAGITWSERLPVPESFSTSLECPAIFRLKGKDGVSRLFIFGGGQCPLPESCFNRQREDLVGTGTDRGFRRLFLQYHGRDGKR